MVSSKITGHHKMAVLCFRRSIWSLHFISIIADANFPFIFIGSSSSSPFPAMLSLWPLMLPVSVGQCYTNFELRDCRVHMGWDVCIMDLIQRVLWEAGMQHRHGVLSALPACGSQALQNTHSYSHTFPAVTHASPWGQGAIFITVFTCVIGSDKYFFSHETLIISGLD